MKKTLFLSILTSLTSYTFAQSVKFGVSVGLNESTFHESNNTVTTGNSSSKEFTTNLTGFHIGAFLEFAMKQFAIQPGLMYTTKGSNVQDSNYQSGVAGYSNSLSNQKETLNYLEVPVNVLYYIPVKKMGRLFIGAGPYYALGIAGNINGSTVSSNTISGTTTNITTIDNGKINYGNSYGEIKNPDYGINTQFGLATKNGVKFGIGYGFGLSDLSTDNTSTLKNQVLSFSLSYLF
ncbi:MAG: outer membrane beta-barrel protein [Mucilaginibacter sp.]